MRQGRVVRPEGNRGILLTDWRPDRLHRPHSARPGSHFLFAHITIPPSQAPCPVLCSLNLQPCQLHLPAIAISASLFPTKAARLHVCPPPLLPPSLLPLATRHSQMSAGSCITETARLSAVVTWHLKAVRAWDTVASHSTLIAVY